MWLDVAQGQENSNGVFSSHAVHVFRQETCELGGVLWVVFLLQVSGLGFVCLHQNRVSL